MAKIQLFYLVFILAFCACASTNKTVQNTKAGKIVSHAKSYIGTRYQFGGVSKKGMDCSGLVYVAFQKENIQLPRVSRYMAKKGTSVPLKKVQKGDLLFFNTQKNSRKINHVGLVSYAKNGVVKFIHATTSKGVIESLLSHPYWKKAFVKATKVLF